MKKELHLSDHFTYSNLIRFTIPSIIMMVFSSIYGIVDGIFVSNFAGKTAFAALNFIMPFIIILSAAGFMLGTGGTALISKTLGEGRNERANQIFSMIIYVTVAGAAIITVIGLLFLRTVAAMMGAEGEMLEYAVLYGRIIILGHMAFTFQMEFQSLCVTAERPRLGLIFTLLSGVLNMILDALFVGLFGWGLQGAACASVLGQIVGGIGPLVYFILPNHSLLRVGRPWFGARELLKICTNGISELLSNISASVVGILFNIQLLRYAGENGVAAYGILMYVCMVFLAIFIGYSMGSAPVVGFQYGAKKTEELKSLLRKSTVIILITSAAMGVFAFTMAGPFSTIFASYDQELYDLTVRGFRIYAFSFLFSGVAVYGSSFFTALNNGKVSALISFLRTVVFETAAVMLLPLIYGIDGVWYSIVVAEVMATILTVICLIANRRKYGYF